MYSKNAKLSKHNLEIYHNYIYNKLNLDFNYLFGELDVKKLTKDDTNLLMYIYYFWKDRFSNENNSINQNIINNYSIHNLKIVQERIFTLGLTNTFENLLTNFVDPLSDFYKRFKTTRFEHIMKISEALGLYKKAKDMKETFVIVDEKIIEKLNKYKVIGNLLPEPCIYLSKQKLYKKLFDELLEIKDEIINKIFFHRKTKAIINYYNYMYFNFEENYGDEFSKCISNFNSNSYMFRKSKRLRIK